MRISVLNCSLKSLHLFFSNADFMKVLCAILDPFGSKGTHVILDDGVHVVSLLRFIG